MTKKELEEQNTGLRDMLKTSFELLRTTLAFVAEIGGTDELYAMVTRVDQTLALIERQAAEYQH